jgi:hypothetical protein
MEQLRSIKPLLALGFLASTALLAGCAADRAALVLAPVGPSALDSPAFSSNGILIVYSAFEQTPDFNSLPYREHFTDYTVYSAQDRLLQVVHNDLPGSLEGPREVVLPAGAYRVLARANGYGLVTVPVVIEANRVTTVHLEGGGSWSRATPQTDGCLVKLPHGEIIGWQAGSRGPSQVAVKSPAKTLN